MPLIKSQTCVNGRYRHGSSFERRCVTCVAGPANEFPMWEADEIEEVSNVTA